MRKKLSHTRIRQEVPLAVHSSTPVTSKRRGRPRRYRSPINADGAKWEVDKIVAEVQSGERHLLKNEMTPWIAEGDILDLHNLVVSYRRKEEQKKGKTKGGEQEKMWHGIQ